jgi:hypothetical protein
LNAIKIVEAEGKRLERWDDDVGRAVNGTIFHLRRFLEYHADRFRDQERFLLVLDGDNVIAQLPAAVEDSAEGLRLRSPYGASYGGFAFQRHPTFAQATRVVESLLEWLAAERIERATVTPPIAACSVLPLDVVSFALLVAGFTSANRDISSLVRLDQARPLLETVTSRARNAARKAEREGVTVRERGDLDDFWLVMESTFSKHGTRPTHTQEEFQWLAEMLPDRVYADLAYHDGEPVAGVGYFVINSLVNSSFYFCQRPDRQELNGLTLCVLRGLERAQEDGFRWFDFGTSTARMEPRENVFRFKEQFASAGQFRETFEWSSR